MIGGAQGQNTTGRRREKGEREERTTLSTPLKAPVDLSRKRETAGVVDGDTLTLP